MFCIFARRKLPLFISDDLHPRMKMRVVRHIHTCRRCYVEFKRLRFLRDRLGLFAESPPPETLDRFSEEVMSRIPHARSDSPHAPTNVLKFSLVLSLRRVVLAGLMVIFASCAFVRYTWVDEFLTLCELQRSVVTRDGLIVSDARLHGRDAYVTVIKDEDDMVIIWLKTPPAQSDRPRRG